MKEKNGIGESKPKQSRRQGESAPELPVGRAYAVKPLAVGKVLKLYSPEQYSSHFIRRMFGGERL